MVSCAQAHHLMRIAPKFIPIAILVWLASAQQPPSQQQKPSDNPNVLAQQIAHPQPVTEDLSQGANFKFKIAPNLPEFTFKVIPEPGETDEYGNPHSTVGEVQVFRADSKEPMQSLEDCELGDMEAPPRGSDWFRAEDVNFDGYADIFLLTTWGATGNQFGCVWLYDSEDGRFWYSKDFTEIAAFEVHPETKTLTTHGNGGMAGTVFRAAKYIVENNRPVPIVTVAQDWDMDKKEYHCVVEQRRQGKFVIIRDLWAKPKNDFDAPCDTSHPFGDIGDK